MNTPGEQQLLKHCCRTTMLKNPAFQSYYLASHNDFLQSIVILAYMFSSLTFNFKVIKRITTNHMTSLTLAIGQAFA